MQAWLFAQRRPPPLSTKDLFFSQLRTFMPHLEITRVRPLDHSAIDDRWGDDIGPGLE